MIIKWSQFFHIYGFYTPLVVLIPTLSKDGFLPLTVAVKAPSDARIWALCFPAQMTHPPKPKSYFEINRNP